MSDVWVSLEQSEGGPAVTELAAKIVEGHRVASRKVDEAGFDGGERRWIGEDLCGSATSLSFVLKSRTGTIFAMRTECAALRTRCPGVGPHPPSGPTSLWFP